MIDNILNMLYKIMKSILVFLFLLTTFSLSACNENKKLEKENMELKKELEKKNIEDKEALEKENIELKKMLEQKKERFYYIKDTVKVDTDSILVDANGDLYYDVHVIGKSGRFDTIIKAMVLCDDATAYMVRIDAPDIANLNTDNVGPHHKFSIRDSGHASYVYDNYCYFNQQ